MVVSILFSDSITLYNTSTRGMRNTKANFALSKSLAGAKVATTARECDGPSYNRTSSSPTPWPCISGRTAMKTAR